MKKGNKVLALFLAAVMLVTSIAWDFSDASVAEAEETESATEEGGHSGLIEFDDVDVMTLETDFTASQYLNSDNSLVGESEQAVSTLWYSGTSGTSAGGTALSSKTTGLKAKADTTNTYNHMLNYNKSYKNFKATVELYFGSNMGVILGEKTVYPTSTTSPAINIWLTANGTIGIKGAFDGANGKVTGAYTTWSNQTKLNHEGYILVAKQICDKFGCKKVAITLRGFISANDNDWAAMLYTDGQAYLSPTYRIHIVDRVGGGITCRW